MLDKALFHHLSSLTSQIDIDNKHAVAAPAFGVTSNAWKQRFERAKLQFVATQDPRPAKRQPHLFGA
jgi:hypothetical protein